MYRGSHLQWRVHFRHLYVCKKEAATKYSYNKSILYAALAVYCFCCDSDIFVQFTCVRLKHIFHSKRLRLAPTPFQHTVNFSILLCERKLGPGFV